MAVWRYTRGGNGQAGGGAWNDARPFSMLDQNLRQAAPGDRFLIGFDRDREDPVFWRDTVLRIARGGAASRPVAITAGYVGHNDDVEPIDPQSPMTGFIHSGLSQLKRASPVMTGEPCISVSNGVEHLQLAGFSIRGAPHSGLIRFEQKGAAGTQPFQNLVLRGIHGERVGRIVETERGTRLVNVQIEDCSAFGISRGFARFRSIERSTLRRLVLDGGGIDGGGENVCQMLAFESGSQVVLESIFMNNAVNMLATGTGQRRSHYVQGDGIVCELETADFRFRDCHASAMGDSGFDLKTRNFVMQDCSAVNCKFGIRIWSEGPNLIERTAVHSPRPAGANRGACIWFAGKADLVDCDLQAGSWSSVFESGEGGGGAPLLKMHGGSIRTDGARPLLGGSGRGRVELHGVSVNGETRNDVLTL